MNPKSSISLIVPVYNMGSFLPELWSSISQSGLLEALDEVVFVDDGSTDDTAKEIRRLSDLNSSCELKISPVILTENKGRFFARYYGAQQALGYKLLFLDARNKLKEHFVPAFKELSQTHDALMGIADVDLSRGNIFCLYWERSHARIFARHFEAIKRPFNLTLENYDQYLKGTTVFMCKKDIWLKACEVFEGNPPLNDDTYLLKEVVRQTPIHIDPRLRINWIPRENWKSFLARLWERGPSFAEYHIFAHKGAFFYIVMAGLVFIALTLACLFVYPNIGFGVIAVSILGMALSAGVFAKSFKEFFKIAPLHTAVLGVFGSGILYGIFVNLKKQLSKA